MALIRNSVTEAPIGETVRERAATASDDPLPLYERKPFSPTAQDNAARRGAASRESALCRTRTYDPLIKSQLLCRLS